MSVPAMSRYKKVLLYLLVASALGVVRPASAQESGADKAAAEALYQMGKRFMEEGKYADACPKLEASHKLDPGVGTLLLLGDCQEKLGKLASAWASFQEAAALAKSRGDASRAGFADVRASALRPRLNRVIYKVNAQNDVEGFELHRAGNLISKGSWGVELPTDPGSYELVASAPGRETWKSTISVPQEASDPVVVEVPLLKDAPQPATNGSAASVQGQPLAAPSEDRPARGSTQRTVGVLTMGAGVAVAIAGGVFTLLARNKFEDSKEHCLRDDSNVCDQQGVTTRNDAQQLARVATVLGISAGVVVASGAVIYFTAPRDEQGKTTGLMLGIRGGF